MKTHGISPKDNNNKPKTQIKITKTNDRFTPSNTTEIGINLNANSNRRSSRLLKGDLNEDKSPRRRCH